MNVILKENVENLGTIGDLVRVSEGYARNFLFPRKLATVANEKEMHLVEHHKRALKNKLAKVKEEKEEVKNKLEALSLVIRRKSGENSKLFGSITNQDVAETLKAKGIEIERKQIDLGTAIKKLGSYKVAIRLMEGLVANVNLSVVADVD